jgi:hypothetical protein
VIRLEHRTVTLLRVDRQLGRAVVLLRHLRAPVAALRWRGRFVC